LGFTHSVCGLDGAYAAGPVEQIGGTYASVPALAAVRRARETGRGEHIDFSLLEVTNTATTLFMDLA